MNDLRSGSTMLTLQGYAPLASCMPQVAEVPMAAANENLKIKSDWMTPAEALQLVISIKKKLLKENAENFALFHSAARRKAWDEIAACEACLRWHYFRTH